MKYAQLTPTTTLSNLSDLVGERNVDYILNINGLSRCVKVGQQLFNRDNSGTTSNQDKINVLNSLVANSDVFEKAALGSNQDWVSLSKYGSFPDFIKIPDVVPVPLSATMLGNGEPVSDTIYNACMQSINDIGTIDPAIFNVFSAMSAGAYGLTNGGAAGNKNPFEWFQLPWGKISLYSSISGEMIDFPVYPEELSDGFTASYDQMPDMLYQYEPWQVYKSSGPRTNTYSFHMHRDMWTGDHRDGLANKLVRFCEANCFPEYNGSAVKAPLVTLYINSVNHITGIMTDCKVDWKPPFGLDGFYLELTLQITITEVSQTPLNYTSMQNRGLIE